MTDRPIKISPDLALPLDVVTETLGLVGMRGVGKTHLLSVLCEELISAGAPVAILDPLGVLHGLRSSKDGKRPGLSVVVLGGEHGDVPLESTAGRVIADWVVAERRPCVLDLSGFRKAEQRRFATDFGVRLYERNREPLHLVVDEADLFAPQRPRPDEAAMLGAFEDLVRRGRARGIGLSLATQRPAVLHKDVLTQVGALVALRVVGPQDRSAIEDWIRHHGTDEERKTVLASLGSLPIGTAWFWSPGWLGILKRVRIRDRQTFDSSSTPKLGAKRAAPQKLAPVDLEGLKARIAETIKRAEADDPRALRSRIAELERALEQATKVSAPVTKVVDVEVAAVSEAMALRLEQSVEKGHAAGCAFVEAVRDIMIALPGSSQKRTPPAPKPPQPTVTPAVSRTRVSPISAHGSGSVLPKVERLILTALAQQYPREVSRERLALLVGYHANSKSFSNSLGSLRSRGAIEGTAITETGLHELGDYDELPSGPALFDWYCEHKLGGPEAKVLSAIAHWRSGSITRDGLAAAVGYHPNAKSFSNALGRLRGLGLVVGLSLSEELR